MYVHVPDNQNMIMKLKRENFIFIQCFISTFGCVMYIKVCIDINFFYHYIKIQVLKIERKVTENGTVTQSGIKSEIYYFE